MPFLSPYKDGRILIRIYVQPRASRNAFIGIHDDAVKLAITAPPVDGKANAAVVKYLASFFRIKKKDLEIISGLQSRRKSLLVTGLSEEEIRARMQEVSR
ncbi:MAG TPA: YggU family protein [Desulfocapsa sulfexigens]|nr:YggU family protein [Desulfocapsa sulfexigens]HIQ36681.1 YggU family protein [Desulfocapsa sulfexigens]